MLRGHRELLLNWFCAKGQLSSGVVEGFNTKAKLTTRKAFVFRTYHALEVSLYHVLGALPEMDSRRLSLNSERISEDVMMIWLGPKPAFLISR